MTLENVLEEIGAELKDNAELVSGGMADEHISDFLHDVGEIRRQLANVEAEGRVLRLGIVGQVKAGKTSFLNALFFHGQPVLPQAATPMTAALTKIGYSEHPSAKVVFYDDTDWGFVEGYSKAYESQLEAAYQKYLEKVAKKRDNSLLRQPLFPVIGGGGGATVKMNANAENTTPKLLSREDFEKTFRADKQSTSCHEVYRMAYDRMSAEELRACLNTEKPLQADSYDTLMNVLNDYSGSGGKYTPIVKYVQLALDLPELKDVEIIDTPGMNDPVLSRDRKTKEFLKECDAVFLLSYCGQFLGSEDMTVISRMLPENGIARCVLIGTKTDSALWQYPDQRAPFRVALKGTSDNCVAQASENIRKLPVSIQKLICDADTPITENLYLTSALAYSTGAAMEAKKAPSAEGAKLADNFRRNYPDFPISAKNLMDFSQIQKVQDKALPAIRKNKDKLIEKSKRETRNGQRSKFVSILEDISIEAREIRANLQKSDIDQLIEQRRKAEEGLDRSRRGIKNAFDSAAVSVGATVNELQIDIRVEMENHLHIGVATETEIEHCTGRTGFLGLKKESWDKITTNKTATIEDARNNIHSFHTAILSLINVNMPQAINLNDVKEQVKEAAISAFDTSDRNFDAKNMILVPVENTLRKLTIPQVEIDEEMYLDMLERELLQRVSRDNHTGFLSLLGSGSGVSSGTMRNEAIPLLIEAQNTVLRKMTQDACGKVKELGAQIEKELNENAGSFADQIEKAVESRTVALKKLIDDKEGNIKKLKDFINRLDGAKKRIEEAE